MQRKDGFRGLAVEDVLRVSSLGEEAPLCTGVLCDLDRIVVGGLPGGMWQSVRKVAAADRGT